MSGDIRIADPDRADAVEPVPGLIERTPFRVGDRRLVLLQIDEASSWHTRDGTLYGWVRAGQGHVASGGQLMGLEAGDFLRVHADTVHRYVADTDPLEVLAVVEGESRVAQIDTPTDVDGDAEPAVAGPDELVPTVESSDLLRETPFPDDEVLLMRVRAAGGAAAGWHHHGDNVYFGYAVDGPSETEHGPAGESVARIEIGECFHVPPGLVHRDTNPTAEPHTGIIWLCGGEPWVVNVDSPASL